MRIIVDVSNIIYGRYRSVYEDMLKKGLSHEYVEKNVMEYFFRKLIILRKKFHEPFNNFFLAWDNRSWRKGKFAFYKAKRQENRKRSVIDEKQMFAFIDKFKEELTLNFPMTNISVEGAEADDILSTIAKHISDNEMEPVLLVTRDKDMLQCINDAVRVFDPFAFKFRRDIKIASPKSGDIIWKMHTEKDAKKYLLYQIISGDEGDGVPSVKCPDDVFMNPTLSVSSFGRFGPVTIIKNYFTDDDEKNKTNLLELHHNHRENFKRNQLMVDLSLTPRAIKEEILRQYKSRVSKRLDREDFLKWCEKFRLYSLFEFYEENK